MLHGYCIRRRADALPEEGVKGVDGAVVSVLTSGDLSMWVSVVTPLPATIERLRDHDRVLRDALRSETPLPLRFGARFESEAEADVFLEARAAELSRALDRVKGSVEMGITLRWMRDELESGRRAEATGPSSGRAYLEARKAELEEAARTKQRADALLDRVQEVFMELELPTVRTPLLYSGSAMALAHLVHLKDVPLYRKRLGRVRQAVPEISVAVTGPWAPYSFVKEPPR